MIGVGTSFVACDDDEINFGSIVIPGEGDETPGDTLFLTGNGSTNLEFERADTLPSSVPVVLDIRDTDDDNDIDRIYVTQRIGNGVETAFELTAANGVSFDLKGDGSIDVDNSVEDTLQALINVPVPAVASGTVTYRIWATSGRGDFRDPSKRSIVDAATITLEYGGSDAAAGLDSGTVTLRAPLANGSSESFFSAFNGEVYTFDNAEEVDLWDIAYFYGTSESNGAVLMSPAQFQAQGVQDIVAQVNADLGEDDEAIAIADLNMTQFLAADSSVAFFNGLDMADDLNIARFPENEAANSTNTTQRARTLAVGDFLYFRTDFGRIGAIYITSITIGNGSAGQISFRYKIQTSAQAVATAL